MRNRSIALFLGIFLIVPCTASAVSVADLQAQIDRLLQQIAQLQQALKAQTSSTFTPAAGAALSCPQIVRPLSRGMQGGDVRALQIFLQARGLLAAEPTGFFGELTEMALKAFQSQEGIVSSGTPQGSGWGVVGPRTRAAIALTCGSVTSPASTQTPVQTPVKTPVQTPTTKPAEVVPPRVCTEPPAPSSADTCLGVWEKVNDFAGCAVGWSCRIADIASQSNKAPRIVRMDGPSEVYVNQSYSWTISANDPEGGSLQYSMVWGDEGSDDILSLLAGLSPQRFAASPTQSHTYVSLGWFTTEITVRDGAGNQTTGTFPVRVVPRMASSSTTTASTTPVATYGSCMFANASYPDGTITEGYSINDLCLATAGMCTSRAGYIPKFKCALGEWKLVAENPYPGLPNYGNVVGTQCSQNGALQEAVVAPNTQLCRGELCATTQNYAKLSLTCSYINWVDWGLFTAGATTTTICANPTPCEYGFGQGGRACAPKQSNGQCQSAPFQNHPI